MVEFKEAGLVKSLAGHDKNELYIIISVQGEYVYLSDGGKHPLSKQKRKNRKHLQLMDEHDETLRIHQRERVARRGDDRREH